MTKSKETIKTFVELFKRYAHNDSPECDIEECPEDCTVGHILHLDTSMAWVVSWYLAQKRVCYGLREIRSRVSAFSHVVDLHYHKYKSLRLLLDRCYWFLTIQIKNGDENED